MPFNDNLPEIVARDDSSRLRIRARDKDTNAPLDLTGHTVYVRWVLDNGDTEERTMTVLLPTTDPVMKGRADYVFLAADVVAGGILSYEVRLLDNQGRALTSVNTEIIRVKEPFPEIGP